MSTFLSVMATLGMTDPSYLLEGEWEFEPYFYSVNKKLSVIDIIVIKTLEYNSFLGVIFI